MLENNEWWKKAIIYQIYPRSFKDTTNNGIGDLQGVIEKLDYLHDLEINAIWLNPIYPSPMFDFGYDLTDFVDIDPLFGTLADFDSLVEKAHALDIKIIMDYVANHTSIYHPWFEESRKSRDNAKKDYYIWKDAKPDGSVPNNWLCVPGGSAWEWNEDRKQYYYHSYLKYQADVNWSNPQVQKEMLDVLKFWLEHGVDGFRVDMISWLYKDPEWRDNPINPDYNPEVDLNFKRLIPIHTVGQPELINYWKLISETVNSYKDRVVIGEMLYETPLEEYPRYYGPSGNLIHIPVNFKLLITPWNKNDIQELLKEYFRILNGKFWPNFKFGNHDISRMATHLGGREKVRCAVLFLLTMKGTPFVYNGEELGMVDVPIKLEDIQDTRGKANPKISRDAFRTPMQWNSKEHAGFSNSKPWLPVSRDYQLFYAESELQDEQSILHLYK